MKLYNTKSRSIEKFAPLNPPTVTFYSCGPTVYDYTHIGHLRTYASNDFLRRTLVYSGLKVNHVMNITDVGHLTGEETDTGEDKLEKGAKKFGKSVEEVASEFTDYFMNSLKALDIIIPENTPKATDHIQEMIDLIKQLEEKGAVYETDKAVFFDTSKFENYGKLSGQNLDDKQKNAREDVYVDPSKKNTADFVLWFKRVGRHKDHIMHWDSPWGDGFPGWHIECSAMSMKYLGNTIDIHAGGIDHIPVHHENEIAQSECATGETFVRFWFHNEFLMINGEKMSKSKENLFTVDDIKEKGIDPRALRYLFMQTHYRQVMNFTWDSLEAAAKALAKLEQTMRNLQLQEERNQISEEKLADVDEYRTRFIGAVQNDLQLPQALAIVWEMLKSNIPSTDKLDLLRDFDEVLGLSLSSAADTVHEDIPDEIKVLADERIAARASGDYEKADSIREFIQKKGYEVKDTSNSYVLRKI